jgi:hypothetical protein
VRARRQQEGARAVVEQGIDAWAGEAQEMTGGGLDQCSAPAAGGTRKQSREQRRQEEEGGGTELGTDLQF